MKLGTQHYLVYIVVLKWLELKTKVICLKLRAKFLFVFLSFFGTFLLKAIQTMFIWHETWNTTSGKKNVFAAYHLLWFLYIRSNK